VAAQEWESFADLTEIPQPAENASTDQGAGRGESIISPGAAAVVVSLFLLAFAFAGFAAFIYLRSLSLAHWGCCGAAFSLIAAVAGLRMATTSTPMRGWQRAFALTSVGILGSFFAGLVWAATAV
jgi:hypothetical protein